jgi:predicted DNA-binding transcriptional regulator YafY
MEGISMAKGDRLPRLLKLVSTIQHHPGLTADELAKECEVVPRQIYRDLKVLEYAGVPIYNDNGYRVTGNFLLQDISFSLDEALSLLYGLKLIERQKALFPIKRVKERLLSLLPQSLRDGVEDTESRVDVTEGPAADYTGKADLFHILNQSMREFKSVEIEYYSFDRNETNRRVIDPYHMAFKDGFWYLVAYCHWRGEERLFRVDRIKHLHLLAEKYKAPPETFRNPHWNIAWGIELGEEYVFKVRFRGDTARFVRETRFHPHQTVENGPDESVIFTAPACGLRPVCRWILSFGSEAEVLEPLELREMVKEQLKAAYVQY